MLSRIENRIMYYLFEQCRGKRTVLISADEITARIATRRDKPVADFEITKKQLANHMKNLVLDGYVDFNETVDKNGRAMYVVTLTTRGEAFQREHDDRVRRRWASLGWKVLLTLVAFGLTSLLWYLVKLR